MPSASARLAPGTLPRARRTNVDLVRMLVLVRRFFVGIEGMGGHGFYQAAVLHAFEPDEAVGELLDIGGLAVNDQDLKTRFVIEMGVAGGNDEVMEVVLKIG